MRIDSLASALSSVSMTSPGSLSEAISVKMLENNMEQVEAMNVQLVKMMEQSVNPNVGGNIDVRI